MARILFAWECGGGISHLTRYADLIDQLINNDHDIVFAARSLSSAARVFGEKTLRWCRHRYAWKTWLVASQNPDPICTC